VEVAREADLVILAIPLGKYRSLPATELSGTIVVDAMNYWTPNDGYLDEFEGDVYSSAVVAAALPGARLVRAFNHLGYHQLDEDGRPPGSPDRHAIAIAGDDREAVEIVAALVDSFGFDPVDAGPLAAGIRFGSGSPLFGVSTTKDQVARLLAESQLSASELSDSELPASELSASR
jgi:predicted dinucleotide-binding enzyme